MGEWDVGGDCDVINIVGAGSSSGSCGTYNLCQRTHMIPVRVRGDDKGELGLWLDAQGASSLTEIVGVANPRYKGPGSRSVPDTGME